jgi:hypothetical protein
MSDIMEYTGPSDPLDDRLQHQYDLQAFLDPDTGRFTFAMGRNGRLLCLRPGSDIAKIFLTVNKARNERLQ